MSETTDWIAQSRALLAEHTGAFTSTHTNHWRRTLRETERALVQTLPEEKRRETLYQAERIFRQIETGLRDYQRSRPTVVASTPSTDATWQACWARVEAHMKRNGIFSLDWPSAERVARITNGGRTSFRSYLREHVPGAITRVRKNESAVSLMHVENERHFREALLSTLQSTQGKTPRMEVVQRALASMGIRPVRLLYQSKPNLILGAILNAKPHLVKRILQNGGSTNEAIPTRLKSTIISGVERILGRGPANGSSISKVWFCREVPRDLRLSRAITIGGLNPGCMTGWIAKQWAHPVGRVILETVAKWESTHPRSIEAGWVHGLTKMGFFKAIAAAILIVGGFVLISKTSLLEHPA